MTWMHEDVVFNEGYDMHSTDTTLFFFMALCPDTERCLEAILAGLWQFPLTRQLMNIHHNILVTRLLSVYIMTVVKCIPGWGRVR